VGGEATNWAWRGVGIAESIGVGRFGGTGSVFGLGLASMLEKSVGVAGV
jgi:hypothetical protein